MATKMKSYMSITRRIAIVSSVAAGLVAVTSAPAAAQADARWQAALGCWEAVTSQPGVLGGVQAPRICVLPAAGTSAVNIVPIRDGKAGDRTHIEASGARRALTKDGCTGWERAEWSPDARRVYVSSEYECATGMKRASSGIISLTARGELLSVQGIATGGFTGVNGVRYRSIPAPIDLPEAIASQLNDKPPEHYRGGGTLDDAVQSEADEGDPD